MFSVRYCPISRYSVIPAIFERESTFLDARLRGHDKFCDLSTPMSSKEPVVALHTGQLLGGASRCVRYPHFAHLNLPTGSFRSDKFCDLSTPMSSKEPVVALHTGQLLGGASRCVRYPHFAHLNLPTGSF